ncbi:signal transduction histidine kinase [Filimonas zeae]|uniref:histidine kinase n=1 Tax=Filimonas zeae TaxID=1737353 RepID=A0A917J0L4_9BACT|nr:HAMP domain-containing sensor histidine kinase [Filimonas zeae]MDR6338615.1 signal transduction histidine kinase [Filimonas zeae]GGH67386.1 hypothetical protein GCM10011379_22610 [Filimonas zeae]
MWQIVRKWINTGASNELDFIKNTRIRIINLASLLGGSVSFLFSIINAISGNYLLAGINIATLLSLIGLLVCNARQNFLKGPAIIMVVISLVLCLNGLLFNNNMEFYVLLVVCLGLVLFDNLKIILAIILLNSLFFLITHLVAPYTSIQPATAQRQFLNLAIWLGLLLSCLYSFKKQSLEYLTHLEAANENLKASNHAKEKLFSIVAHDMRSPLNSLSATLELLDNEYITQEKFRELSGLLANQTKHLNENMEVLLKWAHSQLKGIEVHAQKIDACTHIAEILALLQPLMKFKNIETTWNCDSPVWVFADSEHLKLILRNLITNAIKFSYPGGRIELIVNHNSGKQVWIQVKDHGIGISAAAQAGLFTNVVNASAPGTSNEKGIGLGLQLIREFITRNGGVILIKSAPGEGSTFSFCLPAADSL